MEGFGWADFYLVCFIVGFVLTLFSLFAGLFDLHLPTDADAPQFHHSQFDVATDAPGHHAHTQVSKFNFSTITAFLTWFGAAGFLLTRNGKFMGAVVLGLASIVGLVGGAIVFPYLAKFLMKHDRAMEPADFEMVGVIGKLSVAIREGGTGELMYSQGGTRKVTAACSQDGGAIGRQEEVVVLRYEKGIAYVRPWKELSGEEELEREPEGKRNES